MRGRERERPEGKLRRVGCDNGKVFGLEHFGYSAPAGVLDENFGFTGEKVSQQVLAYLKTV